MLTAGQFIEQTKRPTWTLVESPKAGRINLVAITSKGNDCGSI
jgi:hypothetical protein